MQITEYKTSRARVMTEGGQKLYQSPMFHDKNMLQVNDGGDTMCDCDDSHVGTLFCNCVFQHHCGVWIHICCAFIQAEYLYSLSRFREGAQKQQYYYQLQFVY